MRFSSAGTIAAEGQRMPEQAAELSVRYGGDPSEHQARFLTPGIIQGVDLVLTMAREHRSAVVRAVPRANRFTFTIREFAALFEHLVEVTGDEKHIACDGDVPEQLRALIPLVAAQRGVTLPPRTRTTTTWSTRTADRRPPTTPRASRPGAPSSRSSSRCGP
ncbi:hypothetical protein BC477_01045 [Clavibacter michiganensis subsp. michiganensis]|uniref:Uncharacterized protein n=1 Tax=Clavibacter michiganensis subsp. michiganensis TaxID=33013 RepID=A0A251XET9_CLAMM|nr:hypothetical protein BC477_01045 [Clavibacter michiganensis subsp. michiganensis]OUE00837.1 hypothetical protein CMMCAS07_15475 [Clavibacter michiganensis subsp. michiganensis]